MAKKNKNNDLQDWPSNEDNIPTMEPLTEDLAKEVKSLSDRGVFLLNSNCRTIFLINTSKRAAKSTRRESKNFLTYEFSPLISR